MRRVGRRFAGGKRQQARTDDCGVLSEIGRQLAHLVKALLDEQQRGGHLEPELVTAAERDRIAGGAAKCAQQLRQRRRAQLLACTGQRGQRLVEACFKLDAAA